MSTLMFDSSYLSINYLLYYVTTLLPDLLGTLHLRSVMKLSLSTLWLSLLSSSSWAAPTDNPQQYPLSHRQTQRQAGKHFLVQALKPFYSLTDCLSIICPGD